MTSFDAEIQAEARRLFGAWACSEAEMGEARRCVAARSALAARRATNVRAAAERRSEWERQQREIEKLYRPATHRKRSHGTQSS
jgi:hypothetical protein